MVTEIATKKMVVLNPVGETKVPLEGKGLAPRVSDLSNKVIGFLDDGFADELLKRFEELIREGYPAKTIYWRKPELTAPSPMTLLDEVAEKCDAAVVGICG